MCEGLADRDALAGGNAAQAASGRGHLHRGGGIHLLVLTGGIVLVKSGARVFQIADQRLDGFDRIGAVGAHGDFLVLLDAQKHQLDRALGADRLARLHDLDFRFEALGEPDEAGGGAGVQTFMHSDDGRAFHTGNPIRYSGPGAFHRNGETRLLLVLTQFRTENRYTLFLELLRPGMGAQQKKKRREPCAGRDARRIRRRW